jgi:epoxyqueuosine reductase
VRNKTPAVQSLKIELRQFAAQIGLDLVGVTTPEPFDRYLVELDAREESYRERYQYRLETWRRMAKPREVLPSAQSVVVVGFHYLPEPQAQPAGCGKLGLIVAYGHHAILNGARQVCGFLKRHGYRAVMGVHRKEAAVRAGLGVIGKHNLVIHPEFGSWVAYQSIVTDAPLEPDQSQPTDVCGDCRLCLQACPTGALYEPRRLDPRRCVTCLLTGREIASHHWPKLGSYILGCDACQEVCPKNRALKAKSNPKSLLPENIGRYPPLQLLLEMDDQRFQREIIGELQKQIMGDGMLARALAQPAVRGMVTWCIKTFLRGREALPETFVHASNNLKIYQRNAILAAGHLRCGQLREAVARCSADPELKPYAQWALERMGL